MTPKIFRQLLPTLLAPEQFAIAIGDRRDLQRGRVPGPSRSLQAGRTPVVVTRGSSEVECVDCGLALGDCGCNGGARSFASSGVPMPPPGTIAGDYGPAAPGGFTANPFGDLPPCAPGCFPKSWCDRDGRFAFRTYAETIRKESNMRMPPYASPYWDNILMDYLIGDAVTIGPGLTVNVELQPTNGTFALYYYDLIAVDPTTQVQVVDWRAAQPRIEGCPVPCGSGDVAALAQHVMKVPEACCGKPLVAWIDRASENTPLQIPVTNNQAAGDILVQAVGRGYCCSTRIC